MPLKKLNEDEYIAELNRRLKAHPEYEAGMVFSAHPAGSTLGGVAGVASAGVATRPAYLEAMQAVNAEYEVEVTMPMTKYPE